MPDKSIFLDSNIIIYAYSETDTRKAEIARKIIASGNVVISAQVINEFVSVTLRKLHQPLNAIEAAVREILPFTRTASISAETSLRALHIAREYRFAWYDSLIIASAIENNCDLLISEDLQHEQVIEESLTIINPFRFE